ncbi:Flavonoid 3' 5'-methyltransferase [Bienertia sinuspersici]
MKVGRDIVVDRDRKAYEVGLPFIRGVGVEHKIEFAEKNACNILKGLLNKGKEGTFDFAFVDANKKHYKYYHEALLKLVKVEGAIIYDNSIHFGSSEVLDEIKLFEDGIGIPKKKSIQNVHEDIRDVNRFLVSDPRIGITHVSVEDGITLCRRMY